MWVPEPPFLARCARAEHAHDDRAGPGESTYSLLIVSRFRRGARRRARAWREAITEAVRAGRADRRVRGHPRSPSGCLGALFIAPGGAARVGDLRRDRRLPPRGHRRASSRYRPGPGRFIGRNVDRWQLWSASREETPGYASPSGSRAKPGAAAAALAIFHGLLLLSTPRAGAQHRPAERREPSARQCLTQELRGIRA